MKLIPLHSLIEDRSLLLIDDRYAAMLEEIRKRQNFTSLRYHRLDDLIKSIGIDACQVCTYCFNGVE